MTHINSLVKDLLNELEAPDCAPGAVAAAAVAAAAAASLGLAAGVPEEVAKRLVKARSDVLSITDKDTEAYTRWRIRGGNAAEIVQHPRRLAEVAAAIDSALASAVEQAANRTDLAVARVLAGAAATACRIVAEANEDQVGPTKPLARANPQPITVEGSARECSPTGRSVIWMPGGTPAAVPIFVATRAERCWMTDQDGRRWFDATSGMWNVPLGHGRPEVLSAFATRAQSLHALDPFQVVSPEAEIAAEALLALTGLDGRVLFSSSGSEAVETALRVALMYVGHDAPVFALPGAFHGSTAGAASLSGYRSVWEPLSCRVRRAFSSPPNAWEAPGIGFVEPVQGAGGCLPLGASEVAALRVFQEAGGLLVADEVACGLGRVGGASASRMLGLQPDITVFGKGLANGVAPVSATVVSAAIAQRLASVPLEDGHTHSLHPPSLAATAVTLQIMRSEDTAAAARRVGTSLTGRLRELGLDCLGTGAFMSVDLGKSYPRAQILSAMRASALLVHVPTSAIGSAKLIVAPPLDLGEEEVEALSLRAMELVTTLRTL